MLFAKVSVWGMLRSSLQKRWDSRFNITFENVAPTIDRGFTAKDVEISYDRTSNTQISSCLDDILQVISQKKFEWKQWVKFMELGCILAILHSHYQESNSDSCRIGPWDRPFLEQARIKKSCRLLFQLKGLPCTRRVV